MLSQLGIAGGAVHDALTALAAVEHGVSLATRDVRAKATYETAEQTSWWRDSGRAPDPDQRLTFVFLALT